MVPGIAGVVNFADVAERLNPAVVNIDASSRPPPQPAGNATINGRTGRPPRPELLDDPFETAAAVTRRGAAPAPASSSTNAATSSPTTTSSRAPSASRSS